MEDLPIYNPKATLVVVKSNMTVEDIHFSLTEMGKGDVGPCTVLLNRDGKDIGLTIATVPNPLLEHLKNEVSAVKGIDSIAKYNFSSRKPREEKKETSNIFVRITHDRDLMKDGYVKPTPDNIREDITEIFHYYDVNGLSLSGSWEVDIFSPAGGDLLRCPEFFFIRFKPDTQLSYIYPIYNILNGYRLPQSGAKLSVFWAKSKDVAPKKATKRHERFVYEKDQVEEENKKPQRKGKAKGKR